MSRASFVSAQGEEVWASTGRPRNWQSCNFQQRKPWKISLLGLIPLFLIMSYTVLQIFINEGIEVSSSGPFFVLQKFWNLDQLLKGAHKLARINLFTYRNIANSSWRILTAKKVCFCKKNLYLRNLRLRTVPWGTKEFVLSCWTTSTIWEAEILWNRKKSMYKFQKSKTPNTNKIIKDEGRRYQCP